MDLMNKLLIRCASFLFMAPYECFLNTLAFMAIWPALDSSVIKKIYLYIKKIMETIMRGKCIFLSPPNNSISLLDKSSEVISRIERNDFISTVIKTVSPLSVIIRSNILRSILAISLPSLKNGIKMETKRGYKNIIKALFTSFLISGENNNIIIIEVSEKKESIKKRPFPTLTIKKIFTSVIINFCLIFRILPN